MAAVTAVTAVTAGRGISPTVHQPSRSATSPTSGSRTNRRADGVCPALKVECLRSQDSNRRANTSRSSVLPDQGPPMPSRSRPSWGAVSTKAR
jgi:hypothetical protein